ncbi:MAG: omptin family outer membrane protease [Spirochaeta sp.]|nr:omptin family outer membrane protease [Spirochaeta sp.]
MMRRYAVALALIFLSAVLFADKQLEFSVISTITRMFGQTSYELEVIDPVLGVMSLLEFPLGSTVAGLRADLEKHTSGGIPWAVRTSFYTNLGDPGKVMKDSDWFLYQDYPPIYFSYTESDAEMRYLQATVRFEARLYSRRWLAFYATGGYRYQYVDYDIMGYEGWQYLDKDPVDGDPELYVISAGSALKVMEYQITHHAPMAGVALRLTTPKLALDLAAGYQLVLISDYDDHVLRSKLSTAEGTGHGLLCSLDGRYTLRRETGSFRPFLFLAADFSYVYADIEQTQEWYGDLDPYATKGTRYTGISHLIKSALFTSTMGFGFRY